MSLGGSPAKKQREDSAILYIAENDSYTYYILRSPPHRHYANNSFIPFAAITVA